MVNILKKFDLHGFRFYDAIEEMIISIDDCLKDGINHILIIHGYRNGVLRDYFRSDSFIKEMENAGFNVKETKRPNPGATQFKISRLAKIQKAIAC